MTKRLTILPKTKTLQDIVDVCNRHMKNVTLNILDCADCQDCSDAELEIYRMKGLEWEELRNDVIDMIAEEKK